MSEPDLKKLPDDVLIRELKDRGHAVCVFQVSDFADALSVSYDLESLSERDVDALASKIMKDQGNFLMDILGARGNEAIDDLITQGTPHEDALAAIERGKQSVAVAEIVTDLEARGIDPEVLDDLVHDCADATSTQIANDEGDPEVQESAIDAGSVEASDTNNAGLSSQVAYILSTHGIEVGRAVIEDALAQPHRWRSERTLNVGASTDTAIPH